MESSTSFDNAILADTYPSGGAKTPPVQQSSKYFPPSQKYCKSGLPESPLQRLNRRYMRETIRLSRGMQGHQCHTFTLTDGRSLDLLLRRDWHIILTRLRQCWPGCEAWTCYEWSPARGVHLHCVVKGVPNLTEEWLRHVVSLLGGNVDIGGFEDVYYDAGLAHYLTKQLADPRIVQGWPKHFRPVSTTRGWCPGWLSKGAWKKAKETLR
jgi:hypothetical protein